MIFRGINIRKGLELNVPIADIFKTNAEPDGNILAMEIYSKKIKSVSELPCKNYKKIFGKDDMIVYSTKSEKYTLLKNSLDAYVKDVYFAYIDYTDDGLPIINSDKSTEIDFINTQQLDYMEFLRNVMKAQEFSGKYETDIFKHKFIGVGSFTLDEYIESHNAIIHTNIELLNFYIFRYNILSSINGLLFGDYLRDINEQKEYLKDEEYKNLTKLAKKHKNILKGALRLFLQNNSNIEF